MIRKLGGLVPNMDRVTIWANHIVPLPRFGFVYLNLLKNIYTGFKNHYQHNMHICTEILMLLIINLDKLKSFHIFPHDYVSLMLFILCCLAINIRVEKDWYTVDHYAFDVFQYQDLLSGAWDASPHAFEFQMFESVHKFVSSQSSMILISIGWKICELILFAQTWIGCLCGEF